MSRGSRTSLLLLALAAFLGALAPGRADAKPQYARGIQQTLGLNYEPPCSICHIHGQTGDGTPIEPFAWSLRSRGLGESTGGSPPGPGSGGGGGPAGGGGGGGGNVTQAITADETDNVDSDGDGIPDVEELRNGTDVNSPANACIIPLGTAVNVEAGQCTPETQAMPGATCGMGRGGSELSAWWIGALALAAFGRRRARRGG